MTALDEYKTIFAKLQEVQAENERLREEMSEIITALEQYDHWLPSMPEHLIRTMKAVLNASDK